MVVVLVCGFQCGGPGDPSREILVLPIVRSCPSKVRVPEGRIRVKGLSVIGVCRYCVCRFYLRTVGLQCKAGMTVLVNIIYRNIAT